MFNPLTVFCSMKPLGIRNNNPLNIRFSPMNVWKGQTGCNKGFCTFDTMEHGYRAALVLLLNYVKRGYDTISEIVSRWAPESENNTQAYINRVMSHFNGYTDTCYRDLTPDTKLPSEDRDELLSYLVELAWIMSLIETGYISYTGRSEIAGQCADIWPPFVSELNDSLMSAYRNYF